MYDNRDITCLKLCIFTSFFKHGTSLIKSKRSFSLLQFHIVSGTLYFAPIMYYSKHTLHMSDKYVNYPG